MEPLTFLLANLVSILDIASRAYIRIFFDLADEVASKFLRGYQLCKLYGQSGITFVIFGNRTTWRIQAQILGLLKDEDAMAY